MENKPKKLLLFDIDGTLLYHNSNWNEIALKALSEGFDITLTNRNIPKTVGTAVGVAIEVLEANGITKETCGNYNENFNKSVAIFQRIVKEAAEKKNLVWTALPNVKELLQILERHQGVRLGLLTANPRGVTVTKLESAGIDSKVFMGENSTELFGAFGCEHKNRSILVQIAMERYCQSMNICDLDPDCVVVIGDTPQDVSSAHDNSVACVAVATGHHSKSELRNADYILENGFENLRESIDAILQTNTNSSSLKSLKMEDKSYCLVGSAVNSCRMA